MQAPSRSRSRGLGQVGFLRVRAGGNMSAAIHAPAAGVLTSHAVFLLQGMPTPPDFVRVLDYQYQFATGPQWWRRTLLATGKPFGRERLSALGPEVARAYVISVDLQCGLGARLLLRLRGWIFRLTGGSPTQFVWFCFAVPVCGRVLWWLYGRRRGFSSSFSSHA